MLPILLILSLSSLAWSQGPSACTAGQFYDALTLSCSSCDIGKYQPSPGQSLCLDCPAGMTTLGQGSRSLSDCLERCSLGEFLDVTSRACLKCGIGTYADTITTVNGAPVTSCTSCPPDRPITPDIGQDSIDDCNEQCPDGQQVSVQGTAVSCAPCPIGTFRSGAIRLCVNCADGLTTLAEGSMTADQCVAECTAGTFRNAASVCEPCEMGTYSDTPEASSCTSCPPGTTSRQTGASSQSDCVAQCEPGSFIDGMTCSLCPPGQYQEHREATQCDSCPTGFSSPRGSTSPNDCFRICDPGEYLSNGVCLQCPFGQYQPLTGQDSCNSCGPTETTRILGATSVNDCVEQCRPGTYVSGDRCLSCPVGTYSSTAEASECTSCMDGFTTRTSNSIVRSDCIPDCGPGTFINDNECSTCPRNTYQSQSLASGCVRCGVGRITVSEGATSINNCITACYNGTYYNAGTDSCIDCPPGTYQDENFQTRCKDCTSGFTTYPDDNGRHGANSITRCLSTNECEIGRANCHANADCIDEDPGFSCVCQPGYTGDGIESCLHECISNPDYCEHGDCSPVLGGMSRVCNCHTGYTGERCDQLIAGEEESDTNKIIAAVLGSVGGVFLLALLGALIYFLCYRRTVRKTIVEQPPPTYQAPVQHKVIERVIKPQVIRPPKEIERYVVHDVPVVEKVYEQVPVPTITAAPAPVQLQYTEPPPVYTQHIQEASTVADIAVPDVPQTIQTEHGVATFVSAGQPQIVSSVPQIQQY